MENVSAVACDARIAEDVGAIVLPAYPHLDDGHIHSLPPEDVEGQDCHELEVGWPVIWGPALTHLQQVSKLPVLSSRSSAY
jgi:hypothetical protein